MKLYYDKKHEDILFPIQYMSIPADILEIEKGIKLEMGTEEFVGERNVLLKVKDLCKCDPHDLRIINDDVILVIIELRQKRLDKIFPLFITEENKESTKVEIASNIELDIYFNKKHLTFVDLYLFSRTYKSLREGNIFSDDVICWFKRFQEEISKSLRIEKIERSNFFNLEIRVGKINNISDHSNSDTLYIEDVHTTKKLQIVSGLKNHISKAELLGNSYLFLVNLKAIKLRKELSEGMILCANDESNGTVEPIFCREPDGSMAQLEERGFEVIPNLKPLIFKTSNEKIKIALSDLRIRDHRLMFKKKIILVNGKEVKTKIKDGTVS